MSSQGLGNLPLVSGNRRLGHLSASTYQTSPANSLDAFFSEEDNSVYLTRFQTVILVDDSSSMSGPRWQQASDLLADMTKVLATFNPNGLEIHFLNHADSDVKNATTPELIRNVFAIVEPAGASPLIATLLERELSKYILRYPSNSKIRRLNLLVLINDILDDEDQILEVIIQASKRMVNWGVEEQISIQFIQPGSIKAPQSFLESSDDAYFRGHRSNRLSTLDDPIVVKRIPWNPEEKQVLLRKVLFGGIRQQWNDPIYRDAFGLSNKKSLKPLQSSKRPERRMYNLEKPSIRQVLLVALMSCSTQILKNEEQYLTSFDLTWEVLAFVQDHLREAEKLSQVVTLTGTPTNAQASTCEQYISESWPVLGPWLLVFIEDFCDQHFRKQGLSQVSMARNFERGLLRSPIVVEFKMNFDRTLTAAIRSSTPASLSSSEAGLTFEDYGSRPERAFFKLQPKPLDPIRKGSQMCWYPLFEHSVIAVQFSYAQRTQGIGVELSPFLMATLAGIRTAVEFRGGLILRGLSTALIPLRMREGEDAIQWHLTTTNTRDDAIITGLLDEIEGIDRYYRVQDVQQLWAKKAYLGWCSVAMVRLGTQEAEYQDVMWSDPSEVRRHIEFSGFSLSLGSSGLGFGGPTGTANFVIPRAQRTHFMDVENQLKDRLKYSIARPVIVYDTSDQRGWMIPIVCLILYMLHLRVLKLPKPPEASQDGLAPIPYSRADKEAAQEAYEILTKYMEPHSVSTLGNSEKWNDTMALFYIALDTFFGKSKELSTTSSESQTSDISGFELMDAVFAENPFRYNSRRIQRNSGGWAQFGDTVGILFCKGIGDAIIPGAGTNKLCRPWSSVPVGFDYLGAYVPCVIDVLSRQGQHKGSERLRERIGYDLYATCHHAAEAGCSHLQTYNQIANPPDDKKKRNLRVTNDEALPFADDSLSPQGAIILGKRTKLVKSRPGTLAGLNLPFWPRRSRTQPATDP